MLLIKQVQIIDGSGQKSHRGDILIQGERISAIGNPIKKKVDQVIDGIGLMATPGFIDVNTDSDHHLSLFTNPSQEDFVRQGVTTIIGGQCGSSLAPLMYGSLSSINQWSNVDQINVDWGSVKKFFTALKKLKLGIRFETLVGHSTIKRDIAGEEPRDLTESEMNVFAKVLEKALEEGALGLSTGLGYSYGKNTPYNEIKSLVKIVVKHNKIYSTHLRDEKEGLLKSIKETLAVSKESGAKTIISHFRPIRGYESEFEQSLELIDKNLGETNIYFDVNPFEISLLPIYSFLPPWAQGTKTETILNYLKDENVLRKIRQEISSIDLNDLIITDALNHDYLIGKTLEEIAINMGKNSVDSLIQIMEITKFTAMLMSKNLNPDLLIDALFHSRSLIGSNSASLPPQKKTMKLERSTSTFNKFLEIAAGRNLSPEETIKKITAIPAQIFGFKNRGQIKEGFIADIALLKDQKIHSVILNGKQVN